MPGARSTSFSPRSRRVPLGEETLRDLGGALLFGVPLVYTMEIWWLGETSSLAALGWMTLLGAFVSGAIRYAVIGALGPTGALLAGMRCTAMSLALALGLATVIGVVMVGDTVNLVLGETAAIGIPLALGAALGAVLFRGASARDGAGGSGDSSPLTRDLLASALGALFIALPIAPTGEIPTIASMTDTWRIASSVPVCLALSYVILIASGFLQHRGGLRSSSPGAPVLAVCTVTAVGFLVAAALLFAFGVLDTSSSPTQLVRDVAALSIPAVIGASAGRLAAA